MTSTPLHQTTLIAKSLLSLGILQMDKIDAHHHFWELSRFDYAWLRAEGNQAICRDFLPADLKPHLDACGIRKSIFVQTRHELAENRWVLDLCEQNDFLAGIVGWVDLQSPDCEEQLLEFKDHPKFLGIRHVTQDEPDDDFIVHQKTLRGLKVLEKHRVPFDLLFFVKHLRHAPTVAMLCPELPLVLDHLAKPRIKDQAFDDWEANFRAAAKCENVYCKLSGMITEADWKNWKPADLKPYIDIALDAFGPDRLMYGSDWPVCELAGSYELVHAALAENIADLSETEQQRIWAGTAAEFYGIKCD